ncbi:MAG: PLP-dependent aminotransferase family protein [Pseudomonadales bacterium]|nr:PLP-dependent aminotransferase family protein [Pseudomonadales bacterium]NRA16923.1 PLP-dependent aminotransferase family protein [Oceanospirillaceae bacterium]
MSFIDDLATLNISIDAADSQPIYQQLTQQIRQLLLDQRLTPGEQLPSSRKLAQLLGISRTSTLNAYNQLIAEGMLISKPAVGVFVSTRNSSAGKSAVANTPAVLRDNINLRTSSKDNVAVFDAGPDVNQFPFAQWAGSLKRVWRNPDPALLRDFPLGGYMPLRESVARYIKAVRDVDCHPQQVIITAGSRDAVALIASAASLAGEKVALEDPCYPPLRHGLSALGAELQYCPVDSQGMLLPKAKVRLAWITAARQYPLGVTMSIQRRLAWLEYAKQHQCWIVEDDFDSEFHYSKLPLTPLFNLSARLYQSDQQSLILAGSFSKLFFKTLRIGYLIVPESLIETFVTTQRQLGNLASVPIQPALADFISDRRFAGHLRRMRRCYQQRRDFLQQLLHERLAHRLETQLPSGGMHLLAKIKAADYAVDDRVLERQLASRGVSAIALSSHYVECGEQGFLLGFSGAPEKHLELGVRGLQEILT